MAANTPYIKYAPLSPTPCCRDGNEVDTMKLPIQLNAVATAIPMARMLFGKISPSTTHMAGPHVPQNVR